MEVLFLGKPKNEEFLNVQWPLPPTWHVPVIRPLPVLFDPVPVSLEALQVIDFNLEMFSVGGRWGRTLYAYIRNGLIVDDRVAEYVFYLYTKRESDARRKRERDRRGLQDCVPGSSRERHGTEDRPSE